MHSLARALLEDSVSFHPAVESTQERGSFRSHPKRAGPAPLCTAVAKTRFNIGRGSDLPAGTPNNQGCRRISVSRERRRTCVDPCVSLGSHAPPYCTSIPGKGGGQTGTWFHFRLALKPRIGETLGSY